MSQTLAVPQLTNPTRLDKFLVTELPKLSRATIQRAIKSSDIKVNDKKVEVHHWLKPGDKITITNVESHELTIPQLTPYSKKLWQTVAETDDYIIIEKPAGVVVHPAPGNSEPTLVESLVFAYPELIGIGDDALRPGIVHRLDKDVSGLDRKSTR